MKNDYYYCIVLSDEQLKFFAESKYHIDRIKILKLLIDNAVTKETTYKITGFTATLHVGQAAISAVELSNQLDYDKKTITKLLDCMVQLGIITSEKNNRTSIHTLHCVSAWYVNNQQILNPHYIHIKDRQKLNMNADKASIKLMGNIGNQSADECTSVPETSSQSNFHTHKDEYSIAKDNEANGDESSKFPTIKAGKQVPIQGDEANAESIKNADELTGSSQLSNVQYANNGDNLKASSTPDDDLCSQRLDNSKVNESKTIGISPTLSTYANDTFTNPSEE